MNFTSTVDSVATSSPDLAGVFDLCVAKTRLNLPALVENPASWAWDPRGNYPARNEGFFDIDNWTTSFFTGMSMLAFLRTREAKFLEDVQSLAPLYEKKIGACRKETMHDLGFLYSLYSVALHRVTDEARHREVGLDAAAVLAERFVPEGNYIRAWGRMDEAATDYAGLAIIDSLMNMPLLYWASGETGDPMFRQIAIRHTDTTLDHFIRSNDSVYHAFRFDLATGEPVEGANYGGSAVDSHWARGTAWAMYGFALGFRHTGNRRYLEACLRLTDRFCSLLDEELVPAWDFCQKSGNPQLRDSSAATIAVCALQELESLECTTDARSGAKHGLLARLCSANYLDRTMECRGILKHGQVIDSQGHPISAYTSWGDYFLMQALARELGIQVDWW